MTFFGADIFAAIAAAVAAVATVVLAIFAIITAKYAREAFRKQSQEVSDQAKMLEVQSDQLAEVRKLNDEQIQVLRLQAQELRQAAADREREAQERRRDQASRVFIWTETGTNSAVSQVQRATTPGNYELIFAHVKNASQMPVYDVEISWRKGAASWDQPAGLPVLMPGEQQDFNRSLPEDLPARVDRSLFSAVVRFRDAAGVIWMQRPGGAPAEQQ